MALWGAFGFGFLGLVIAVLLESVLIPDIFLDDYVHPLSTLILPALGVGIIEELAKALPISLFLYKKRYFNEHTDGIIYFGLAGLGFGLPENILYTLQFGAGAGVGRLFLTPFFHAATTGLIGYALIRMKLDRDAKWKYGGVILAAVGLHGLYDFGLSTQEPLLVVLSIMITVALTVGLFLLFAHARSLDQVQGLSVVGNNSFCRSCGYPNPKRKLYCAHCGKHA